MFLAFRRSGRFSGFGDGKTPADQHQIGEREQREQLRGVLCQSTVACFFMTEQVFDDMERVLDFRPNTGLQMLQLFCQAPQFVVGQRLVLSVSWPRAK